MKASFRLILAALATTLTLAGCVQEITPPSFENDKVAPASEGSRVIAVSFAPQTKTTLDGLQPKFEDGKDTVLISNTNALDTCVVSVKDNKATISTNLIGPLTAVYPYKAAKMNGGNENEIDTVLVSTEQSGKFADANICMARMRDGKDESLSFENKTAVFKIIPGAGADTKYVEVSAKNFDIANDGSAGSTRTIHVATTTADSVYVSILVPDGLKVSDLKFYDGTNEKAITTGAQAGEEIAAGTLYTVTNANWESTEADIPDGALKGVFSVSADKQVYFSQGNLRYVVSGQKWEFYENQYSFCNTTTYDGHHADTVSLFTWGYDATKSIVPDGQATDNVSRTSGNLEQTEDWGCKIGDDNTWRTLSTAEWQYLFNTRTASTVSGTENARYAMATVNEINGIILLPDTYAHPEGVTALASINTTSAAFSANTYDLTEWAKMESAGAVFLPAAGYRDGSNVDSVGDIGYYWSSTAYSNNIAYLVRFKSGDVYPGNYVLRNYGCSVRLVTDVPAAPGPEQSLVLGPDMIIMKMKGSESKPGIDNVTYPWIEYVNPNSTLDDGTAEVQTSNRWTNLDPATGDIGDGTHWIQVTGKNGSVRSPVLNPTYGRYLIFSVQNIYGMQVFATGSASGSAADGNYLKLTATSDDGEVIEASTTPGTIYGKGDSSDFCTINLNPKKSYEVKAEAAVKEIQVLGIKLINEIP